MDNISAIVLCAGSSTRMKGAQKMLLPWKDSTILDATMQQILSAKPNEIIVVGSRHTQEYIIGRYPKVVINPHAEKGMTTSIQCGISRATNDAHGFMICLGDMPLIQSRTYRSLMHAFSVHREKQSEVIVQPVFNTRRGQPVLFHASFREKILNHTVMDGCRDIIGSHPAGLHLLNVYDPGILQDIDNWETYESLQ